MSTSVLERRRIEAEFAKALFDELHPVIGKARARELLAQAIVRMAHASGAAMAAEDRAQQGRVDLETFAARLVRHWTADDALTLEFIERTPRRLAFNVTRCRYAETYRELGVQGLGDVLSCNRDGEFICGYRPGTRFTRTQTIMQGASHCDFRYEIEDASGAQSPRKGDLDDPPA